MLKAMGAQPLQIGQVAQQTGLSIDAIRFYEKTGLLLPAARTQGGYRHYRQQEVADLEFIQKAQQIGFSLKEIRELFSIQRHPQETCAHVRDLIAQTLAVVRRKVEESETLASALAASLKQCSKTLGRPAAHRDSCPVLAQIAPPSTKEKEMKIEILYLVGCPNHQPAEARISDIVRQETVSAESVEIELREAETDQQMEFLSSPSIRIHGQDVEPSPRSCQTFGFGCRTYLHEGSRAGIPPVSWIRAALQDAKP